MSIDGDDNFKAIVYRLQWKPCMACTGSKYVENAYRTAHGEHTVYRAHFVSAYEQY